MTASYCAYLRKSRADRDAELRGEEETLARHRRIITEYADRNHIHISKWYCEVVSGDTIDDRPVVQELIRDVEQGEWTGVLVVEVERLARGNTRDQGIVSDAFKYSGTKIITPLKTYDPDNEFDEEYFEFGLFMSRREYKTINRRLQRGRIASVKEGKFVGSTAPYGYRKVKIPHDKGYTLEIIPEEADVVRMIFDWYCHGILLPDGTMQRLGTDSIATKLDTLGIKPPTQEHWSRATIADMLRSKVYVGYVIFGRQKEVKSSVNGKIVKTRQFDPDHLCVKGLHPAIIDEDTYELTKITRRENRKGSSTSSSALQNPLSGLIYCKKCGHMMTRLGSNSRNPYATMKCPNKYCDNISSPLFLIEEQLLHFLSGWLDAYELNQEHTTNLPIIRDIQSKKTILARLESDLAGVQAQLNRAYDFLEQGIYTVDVFKSRSSTLQHNIDQISENQQLLQEELERLSRLLAEQEQFAPKVKHLLDTYNTNSVEVNNTLLREIIDKTFYEKNTPNRRGQLHNANFTLDVFPKLPKK